MAGVGEIQELGFKVGYHAYLGFVPRPTEPEEPPRDVRPFIPKRLEISCAQRGTSRPFADGGLGARSTKPETRDTDEMARVDAHGAGVVGWRRKAKAIEVRFLDGLAPGSPVRDARFTAPASWNRANLIASRAVVRNGRLAMTMDGGHTRILRTGTAANEIDLEQGSVHALRLGDDGALVAALHGSDGAWHHHWTPKSATPTKTIVGPVTAVGEVDANGYTIVEASAAFAVRARIAAGGAAPTLGDFRRDAAFASVPHLSMAACEKGATGERFVVELEKVDLTIDRSLSASRVWLEVLTRDGKACIARASTHSGDEQLVRVDFLADKADVVSMQGRWTVREATCRANR